MLTKQNQRVNGSIFPSLMRADLNRFGRAYVSWHILQQADFSRLFWNISLHLILLISAFFLLSLLIDNIDEVTYSKISRGGTVLVYDNFMYTLEKDLFVTEFLRSRDRPWPERLVKLVAAEVTVIVPHNHSSSKGLKYFKEYWVWRLNFVCIHLVKMIVDFW